MSDSRINESVRRSIEAYRSDGRSTFEDGAQCPTLFGVPGLLAQPFWRLNWIEELFSPTSLCDLAMEYKKGHHILKTEQIVRDVARGHWNAAYLMEEGLWHDNDLVATHFAHTRRLLAQLPVFETCMGYVYFSSLSANTEIRPHCGPTNVKLRIQVILDDEDGATDTGVLGKLVVGEVSRDYRANEVLVFDDSLLHSVHIASDKPRLALIVDIWHPDLLGADQATSRERIAAVFPPLSLSVDDNVVVATAVVSSSSSAPAALMDATMVAPAAYLAVATAVVAPTAQAEAQRVQEKEVVAKAVEIEDKDDAYDPLCILLAHDAHLKHSEGGEYDYLFKLLMVGDSGAGKTSFVIRAADDTFSDAYNATIGVDFKIFTRDLLDPNQADHCIKVKLQLWDVAGPERFRSLTSSYYRGAHQILLCYAIDCRESFQSLVNWTNDIAKYAVCAYIVVGLKSDYSEAETSTDDHQKASYYVRGSGVREVSYDEAERFAHTLGVPYMECSARTGEGVDDVVATAIFHALHASDLASRPPRLTPSTNNNNNRNNSKCVVM